MTISGLDREKIVSANVHKLSQDRYQWQGTFSLATLCFIQVPEAAGNPSWRRAEAAILNHS